MTVPLKGLLVEFNHNPDAIILPFQYNPETLTRTRGAKLTINNAPGTGTDFAFATPPQTPRIMQGVSLQEETLSVELIFSLADYMDREDWSPGADGIQPVLDSLRLLVEPRSQKVGGLRMLGALGLLGSRAFEKDVTPSVVLFVWGTQVLPVVITTVSYTAEEFLPNLAPSRATAQVGATLIEAHNPFIFADRLRQQLSAAVLKGRKLGAAGDRAAEALAGARG